MKFKQPTLRPFFFLFLLICLLSGLAGVVGVPVKAAPSMTIVISQVYGGGGFGAAGCSTYKNDYVELHNISSSAVFIYRRSKQYVPAGGTNLQSTIFPKLSISAGQKYLTD